MHNNKTKQKRFFAIVLGLIAFVMLAFSFSSAGYVVAEEGTPFEIEKNGISSVLILCDEDLKVQPGQERNLTVSIFPEVANETLVKVEYQIVRGLEDAVVLKNKLLVPSDAIVGHEVEVVAVVDNVVSENSLVFTIERIPVSEIFVETDVDTISQGETLNLKANAVPTTATDPTLIYEVVSGGEYVSINIDGKITVTGNLPSGDLTATIRITSFSDPEIYCEKTFKLYKPIEAIVSANSNLTEVEQKRSYSFEANVEPFNATFGSKPVVYSVNVSDKIATITQDGLLTISETAPVGTEIIVRIDATDGVYLEQKVTVVPVFATRFAIKNYTAPSHDGKYMPNDRITFDVEFLEPFNITETNKVFAIKISDESLAKVYGNVVVINNLSEIKVNNPYFIVTVFTNQNGTILSEDVRVDIFVPATGLTLNASTLNLVENKTYNISDLLSYNIYPSNTDIRLAEYVLESSDFATIQNGKLVVKDNLPAGKVSVNIFVTAYGIKSNMITFDIYKPTRTLKLIADNENPISRVDSGEVVNLSTFVSNTASVNAPRISIVSGADKIVGGYNNGDVLKNSFQVKANLSAVDNLNKKIVLQAEQDGVLTTLEIIVYIPNEKMELSANALKRGLVNSFSVKNSKNADNVMWEVVSVDSCVELFDVNSCFIKVNQNTSAGTQVVVTYRSLDRVGAVFNANFYVDTLKSAEYEAVYSDSGAVCNDQKFNAIIAKDSENVAITKYASQLMINRYTDIKVKYMGFDLIDFGLKLLSVETSDNATAYLQNYDTVRVLVNDNASGKTAVTLKIVVADGSYNYTLQYDNLLNVFRPLQQNNVVLSQNFCYLKETPVYFDEDAIANCTYGLSDLSFATANYDMVEFRYESDGRALFIVKSMDALGDEYQLVSVSCVESYNEVATTFNTMLNVAIAKSTITLNGGDGPSNMVMLYGLSNTCPVFTRTGYTFNGLYSDSTEVYNKDRALAVDDGAMALRFQHLFVEWRANTYTVKVDTYIDEKFNSHGKSFTTYYDCSVEFTVTTKNCSFVRAELNGLSTEYSNPFTFKNLTSTDGGEAVIKLFAKSDSNCVATGTMVTLADGSQKAVEDLTENDMLLVWNFFTGSFDVAPVSFMISHGEKEYDVLNLKFSDDTLVKVIGDHGFWDINLGKFIFLNTENAKDYIGHEFVKEYVDASGVRKTKTVVLTSAEVKREYTNTFSPMSDKFLCIFVDGMLSVSAETQGLVNYFDVMPGTLKYDQSKMQQDILKYGLLDYETYFKDLVSKEIYESVNAQYLAIAMAKGLITKQQIIDLIDAYAQYFVIGGTK